MKTLFEPPLAHTNDPQTQTERLLSWFNKGNTITSFEAYLKFGITQLGRCIDDLQKQGCRFEKPRERTGGGKIVCHYKLRK